MEKWSNFFIVGAPKAGTTSLHEYLKKIPGIFMSPVKEPYYFCPNLVKENDSVITPIRNKEKYLELFENAENETILGESSVHYLADPDSPKLIHEVSPNAKILISLRDPIERELSHYSMLYDRGLLTSSFHQELEKELNKKADYLEPCIRLNAGKYVDSIKRFLKIFGKENVKIIIFEEWKIETEKTIEDILKFLGLNQPIYEIENKIYNKYVGKKKVPRGKISQRLLQSEHAKSLVRRLIPNSGRIFLQERILTKQEGRKPKLTPQDREFLKNYYREDVKKLETLLGRKLPWKNFGSKKL